MRTGRRTGRSWPRRSVRTMRRTGRRWPRSSARIGILRMDLGECQLCKARGRYRKAALVHHVQHLKDRPDLALSAFDPDTGRRQLVSLCRSCHEEQHPERMRRTAPKPEPLTEERWD